MPVPDPLLPAPSAGALLVAGPSLEDPNFHRTVVLLLAFGDVEGALGVVLNRPSGVLVADVLESWRGAVAEPDVLFRGGPVGTDGAIAVGRLRDLDDQPVGWRGVTGRLGIVDLDAPPELLLDLDSLEGGPVPAPPKRCIAAATKAG